MTLNLASLNVRGLRDSSKCTRLLGELKTLGVDVAAVQETHFTSSSVWLRFMRPISLRKGFPFFRRLAPFLDDTKRLVLMADWNAILDPKIDKVGRGASRRGRCESSLVGFMTRHDLVDRFRLAHPGREMWTWLDSSSSAKVASYLDRVLVRRANIDFVSGPTFHLIAWTGHKLVRVSLRLANRPSLAGYWKFNTS